MRRLLITSLAILLILSLQGFNYQSNGGFNKTRDFLTQNIQANLIYSTTNTISGISVYGSVVAWSEHMPRGDYDIYGYTEDVGVSIMASSKCDETDPVVGSTVLWVQNEDSSTVVRGLNGFEGQNGSYAPVMDDGRIAYLVRPSPGVDELYYGTPNGSMNSVNLSSIGVHSVNSLDISGDYLVVNNYLYSIDDNIFTEYSSDPTVKGKVSGDWLLYSYWGNFGSTKLVSITNIRTGYTKVLATHSMNQFESIKCMDIDGYHAVWIVQGVVYYYNILRDFVEVLNIQNPLFVAIGGGRIAWVVYENGSYDVWYGSLPHVGSYLEFNLKDLSSKVEQAYHQLLIIDSQGRKLGGWNPETGDIYREIPSSTVIYGWGSTKAYRISCDNPSQFRIQVIGKHDGKYDLIVRLLYISVDDLKIRVAWVNATGIPIKLGEIDQYTINWTRVLQGAENSVTLKIDRNGDGNFDIEVTTSSNISADVKDNIGVWSTMYLSTFLLVLAVVVIAVFIVKKRKAKT